MIWSVYELVDPRSGEAFYVGSTRRPRKRRTEHRINPASDIWLRVCEIHESGLKCMMRIVARFPSKHEAMAYERRISMATPGLMNRFTVLSGRSDGALPDL